MKEVSLSLYNKPVTGYRLVIDRGQATVTQHILQHVSFFDQHKPFQYEQTIIYENITYPPVTDTREITLYYMLRNLQEHYTELTVVAMYDYKRSVCAREFPDLSQRLVADIASLVRQASGDIVRYGDVLFDDAAIAKASQNQPLKTEKDPTTSGITQPPAGEVRTEKVLVEKDPFRPDEGFKLQQVSNDSMQKLLIAQRLMLEEKERELKQKEKALEEEKRKYTGNYTAQAEVVMLKDSVEKLNWRILNMLRSVYTGDESRSGDEGETIMRLQEQLNKALSDKAALAGRVDSLNAVNVRNRSDLAEANRQKRDLQTRYDAQKEILDSQAKGQALTENNSALLSENERLKKELDNARNEKAVLQTQLSNAKAGAGNTASLRDSLRLMESRIALLEKTAGNSNAQQETISRQQAQLQSKDQQIKGLEQKQIANKAELDKANARVAEVEAKLREAADNFRELQTASEAALKQVEQYNQQMKILAADLSTLESQIAEMKQHTMADQDSLAALRSRVRAQQQTLSDRDRMLRDTRTLLDTMSRAMEQQEAKNQMLLSQQVTLQKRVDSLAIYAATPGEQQTFIREQWKKLEEWDSRLTTREREIADKEKLDAQREQFLRKKEQDLAAQELRYQNLQERENKIRLRETQLGIEPGGGIPPASGGGLPAPGGTMPGGVKTSKITDGGQEIPVYSFSSSKTYGDLQKQVVGYMVSIGKYHDSMLPEIMYQGTLIPEIVNEPLDIRFRLEATGAGTTVKASFRIPGGSYIDPATTSELHGRTLLFMEKMAAWH